MQCALGLEMVPDPVTICAKCFPGITFLKVPSAPGGEY